MAHRVHPLPIYRTEESSNCCVKLMWAEMFNNLCCRLSYKYCKVVCIFVFEVKMNKHRT